jgi:hypothetical protein
MPCCVGPASGGGGGGVPGRRAGEAETSEIFVFWSPLKIFFTKRPMPKRLLKIDYF